jgi:hypothetical protein
MKTFTKVCLSIGLIAIVFGLGILIVVTASGVRIRDIPTYSLEESYSGVESLDVNIAYGAVQIVEGDSFHIDAQNMLTDNLESYVSDGTWVIRDDKDESMDFLGIHFPIRQFSHWGKTVSPSVIITVPKNFVAKDMKLNIGAGLAEADIIQAETGSFSVDAGRLKIDQLVISGKSQYHVGAGEMVLSNMEVRDIAVDCGVGNIDMSGNILGDNEISCGVGRVILKLSGSREDYSYVVDAGIGNVIIDKDSYHNINGKRIMNKVADNYFSLDCGIGNITVKFNQ